MSDSRPNIVVILADDMGFSDLGSYGGEIPTPNLDALAANGLRFTQFYNAARCSPSRASLLTGLYPHEAGVGHLEETVVPGSRGLHGRLDERAVTLGEVLKQAGYFTAMSGKWHVGNTHGVGPWNRGFDRSITPPLGGLYFPDQTSKNRTTVYIDGRQVPTASPEVGTGHWYASDMFVDWGLRFVREAGEKRKPFFLYLPFTAPHFPLMAPPEDIARFRGAYAAGWDKLRDARFARQKSLGIIDTKARLPARLPDMFDWGKLSPDDRARFERIMEIYAADVFRMDQAIGTLVAALKRSGQFDNTLILFMADNGGNAESGPWGRADGEDLGGPQSNVFAGMSWATLQNTPFSFFKHFTREGGIASPLIASWPQGISRRLNGGIVNTPTHLVDIMPTLVGIGRARYPSTYRGHAILPMDGVSIAPAFSGRKIARREPILWEHEGNRAIRHGRWKAVKRFGAPWELYEMSRDRTETDDLAARRPRVVRQLSAQWDQWAEKSHVDPWLEAYDRGLAGTRQDWGGGRGELTKK
ncbi:arylsulfatase [Novosphingobium kaempferiae]|uniref:arylsulfatase n=1 Tax=Novosphingobium kaempferiae TaxID=2896849 RepID=UPI001E51993A|nr:arylsulfatase [Novosphingobium kaempferiae]